jgi:hypothetical protein
MPQMPILPKQKSQLRAGTVFRFSMMKNADKRVFYIAPKAMAQPKMVKGEIPIEAMSGRDDWYVEVLWEPQP